jgi:hypothetical protein
MCSCQAPSRCWASPSCSACRPSNQQLALDLQGPQGLGTLSVVDSSGQHGVLWNSLGNPAMVPQVPFLLTQGNAVVIGEQGPLTWVDTTDPNSTWTARRSTSGKQLRALPTLSGIVLCWCCWVWSPAGCV